jgi:hypothetical protein
MEGSLLRLLIFSQSVTKHGRHRQFIFLIGNIFLKSSPLKLLAQMNRNIDKCIRLTENNCLQSIIPETNMTLSIYVYK